MNSQIKQQLSEKQFTWLITGVAGFIGSHLLEALLSYGQKIIGVDCLISGYKNNIENVLKHFPLKTQRNFTFYEGNVQNPVDCKNAISGVDFVLHHAATGSVFSSVIQPDIEYQFNQGELFPILLAAKNARVKRFIYASSSAVYGDAPPPHKEMKIGNFLSPYAASKYANELYAQAFADRYGIDVIGLRYFNVFGIRQDPNNNFAAVIPFWISRLLKGEDIFINGDGHITRDFCCVNDIVQANLLAALSDKKEVSNTVFNIASGKKTSLNDLFTLLCSNLKIENLKPIYRELRKGDILHSVADITKAKIILNYSPQYRFEESLAEVVQWYLAYN